MTHHTVTHWEFKYFRRIGVIGELGQYDLLYNFITFQGHTVSWVWPMESACKGYTSGSLEN